VSYLDIGHRVEKNVHKIVDMIEENMWDATTQEEYWKGSSGQDKLKFEDFF
jgi:hypothetical protein